MAFSAAQATRINKMNPAAERDGLGTEIKRLGDAEAVDAAAIATKQDALTNPVTLAAAKPASASAAGVKGQMFFDGTDMYLCTATNTWIKGTLALATWA